MNRHSADPGLSTRSRDAGGRPHDDRRQAHPRRSRAQARRPALHRAGASGAPRGAPVRRDPARRAALGRGARPALRRAIWTACSCCPDFPGFPEAPFDAQAFRASWTRSRPGRRISCSSCTAAATSRIRWPCCSAASRRRASTSPASTARTPSDSSPIRPICPRLSRHLRLLEHLGIPPQGTHKEMPVYDADRRALAAVLAETTTRRRSARSVRRGPPRRQRPRAALAAGAVRRRRRPACRARAPDRADRRRRRGRRHGGRAAPMRSARHRPDRADQPRHPGGAARRRRAPGLERHRRHARRGRQPGRRSSPSHSTRKAGAGRPWTRRATGCCRAARPSRPGDVLEAAIELVVQPPSRLQPMLAGGLGKRPMVGSGRLATMKAWNRYASSPGTSTAATCCTSSQTPHEIFVPVRPAVRIRTAASAGRSPGRRTSTRSRSRRSRASDFDCILFQRAEQYLTRPVRDPLARAASAAPHLPGARPAARVAHRHPPRRRRSGRAAGPRDPLQRADVGQRPHADPRHRARRDGAGARPLHRRARARDRRRQPPRPARPAARRRRLRAGPRRGAARPGRDGRRGAAAGSARCPTTGCRSTSRGTASSSTRSATPASAWPCCEAMMLGVPIVGLATTEMVTAIENGVSGYVDTDVRRLIERMRDLLADPAEARRLGEGARRVARERFGIERFAARLGRDLRAGHVDRDARRAAAAAHLGPALASGGAAHEPSDRADQRACLAARRRWAASTAAARTSTSARSRGTSRRAAARSTSSPAATPRRCPKSSSGSRASASSTSRPGRRCFVPKEELLPFMADFTAVRAGRCAPARPYDLLHANFWMSGLVAAEVKRALGIPFVVTFHALGRGAAAPPGRGRPLAARADRHRGPGRRRGRPDHRRVPAGRGGPDLALRRRRPRRITDRPVRLRPGRARADRPRAWRA